mmetsp:Transcript_7971/g.14654  ORF Transcript_7971/g.14654 Transcript_7971/m.14654 type:complete len:298 (+) Transcript_7971:181-1074(+)
MDAADRRVLLEQRRKGRLLERSIIRMKRSKTMPHIDIDINPFCMSKQRLDWKEMAQSRVLREQQQLETKERQSGIKLERNRLRDILSETLKEIRQFEEETANVKSRKKLGFKMNQRNPPRSPARPKSPCAHMDILTLLKEEKRVTESMRKNKHKQTEPCKDDTIPRVGLMNADDMYRLVHAPEKKERKGRRRSKTTPKPPNDTRKPWHDRLFDPVAQSKATSKPHQEQVGALRRTLKPERDAPNRIDRVRRRQSLVDESPFCLERQRQDAVEMALDNFYYKFPRMRDQSQQAQEAYE